MGEDLADIVAAGAEDGEDRVADAAFQRASGQATVALHVADLRLDGAAVAEQLAQAGCEAAPRTDLWWQGRDAAGGGGSDSLT